MIPRRASAAALLALALVLHAPARADAFADAGARAEAALASHTLPVGTDFRLQDVRGRTRSLADFRGKVVILYFGYTFCPDVCPTDLAQISRAVRELGRAGKAVQPVFITLDPERDTAGALRLYAASFHPRLVALRGGADETRRVADAFRVAYRKVPGPGEGYVLEHAAFTFILDRAGGYVDYIPPGTPAGRTTEMLREALGDETEPVAGFLR